MSPRGLMQDGPLVLGALLQPMERWFAGKTVRTAGENVTVTFAQTADRARRPGPSSTSCAWRRAPAGRVEALDALPLTVTGTYSKVALRAMAHEG